MFYIFSGCSGLTSVTIPSSVTSIGYYAFQDCSGLTSITIPNSVTSIGYSAFSGCSGLTSVTIPNSVTSIGESAFYGCSGLTSVTIPNSVTSIGGSAFYGCSGLTSITIPNSVTSIGGSAFYGCSGLTSITIPNSVTSIDSRTFYNCSNLESVNIKNGVENVGNQAFWGCGSLKNITIPQSLATISSEAFAYCDDLTDVYCMAEILKTDNSSGEGLYTAIDAFRDSNPQDITLHVPAALLSTYQSIKPWKNFKSIIALESGDIPEIQKCATPVISFVNGQVSITCDTEGAKFVSDVSVSNSTYYDSQFMLPKTYKVSVYATKDGYEPSDMATKEITISDGGSGQESSVKGDVNGDGEVNVADHVALSDIIMTATETNIETDKITASFTGGAYIKIDGRIQADSKLNVMFSNKSNKNVTLTKMQLNDAATGIESDNLLDEEVVVAAGQNASYTITVGPLGISKPVISFTYKYNNTTYQAIGEW